MIVDSVSNCHVNCVEIVEAPAKPLSKGHPSAVATGGFDISLEVHICCFYGTTLRCGGNRHGSPARIVPSWLAAYHVYYKFHIPSQFLVQKDRNVLDVQSNSGFQQG